MTSAADPTGEKPGLTWLFAVTLLLSAALLFAVQPMFAKMVLPLLGGSASVWNTCMVFYQAVLLAGYVYAHLSIGWLGARRQAVVHLAVLCLAWLMLPIGVASGWTPPTTGSPVLWLLLLLGASLGLPLFVVSASAPMLQAWFAGTGQRAAKDPYFLYAASNLGSLVALLGYPVVIEPTLSVKRQSLAWAVGYGLLMVLVSACAAALWLRRGQAAVGPSAAPLLADRKGSRQSKPASRDKRRAGFARGGDRAAAPGLPWSLRMRWLALALVPSSLLLGVTAHISTDIAAVPLMWVVPLALYLLTFVLVFARRKLLPEAWMVRLQVPLVLMLAVLFFGLLIGTFPWFWILLHLATFFVTAMVCHGELARTRPPPSHLTEFYLWISLGGVLGGMVNALWAPLLFSSLVEYPLMIAVACLLRPSTTTAPARRDPIHRVREAPAVPGPHECGHGERPPKCPPAAEKPAAGWADIAWPGAILMACGGLLLGLEMANYLISPGFITIVLAAAAVVAFFFRRRPLRFGLGVGVILLLGSLDFGGEDLVIHRERDFFGLLRVKQSAFPPAHVLLHGSTRHGFQSLDPARCDEPLSYYSRGGPLGEIFETLAGRPGFAQVGVTGLGAGTIAAYGRPGWQITFYEIDPAVERIARDPRFFLLLAHSKADVKVVLGDARLRLKTAPGGHFDLLILDAFSSDSIPIHLLTREAFELYLDKLAPDGVLAVHISNRYLDLEPILGRIAAELGLVARIRNDRGKSQQEQADGSDTSVWVVIARHRLHLGKLADDSAWKPLSVDAPLWTDDFSNIVSVLKWSGGNRR